MTEKITLEVGQFRQILVSAAEMGANNALKKAGITKTEINKAEAYRRFSRKSVDGWIASGKITPIKRGNRLMLLVTELESLALTNDLYQKQLLQNVG